MKRNRMLMVGALLCCVAMGAAQQKAASAVKSGNSAEMDHVLDAMDKASANFKTTEAEFVWDQYSKVVDEHDLQKGVVYYRKNGKNVEMAADIQQPSKKYVLFTNGKVQVYQPEIEQITEYCAGKNKADFESFLVLGFGGSGHELAKQFDVTYGGMETVEGNKAAKLVLAPKAQKVRNMFSQIILWIDPARGISVQQEFVEPSGDYRLAKYSNVKLNQNLAGDVFKMKTTGKTKTVRPQGSC
ncbi:MAG: LolA family protein [Terriglobales bacterium]